MTTLEVLEERLKAIEKLIKLRFQSAESALMLARETMETRLESMNEFRSQLTEQTKNFINRTEYDTKHMVLEERIANLDKRVQGVELLKADIQGRIWTLGVVVVLVIAALEFFLHYISRANYP